MYKENKSDSGLAANSATAEDLSPMLRQALDQSPGGVMVFHAENRRLLYMNDSARELLDLEPQSWPGSTLEDILLAMGSRALDGSHMKDEDHPMMISMNSMADASCEVLLGDADSPRYVSIHSGPIVEEGRLAGMVSVFLEASNRIKELRKNDSAVLRLENLWFVSKTGDMTIKGVSDVALETVTKMTESKYGFYGFITDDESVMVIHAWSGEAMKGCMVVDKPLFFPISHAGIWGEAIRTRTPLILNDYSEPHPAKKGYPEGHVPLQNLLVVPHVIDGKVHSVAAVANNAQGYTQNDAERVSEFLQDINSVVKRIEAEEQLRKNEEKYRRLVELMNEGVITLSEDHVVTFANGKLCHLLGRPQEEVLGENFLRFLHPESVSVFLENQELRKSGQSEPYEFRLLTNMGDEVFALSSPTALFNEFSVFVGSYEVVTDITKIKQYEALLVEEKERAISATKAKSAFLANMSHEIRTPLNGVLGMLQVLETTHLTSEQREYVDMAYRSGKKLTCLLGDILDLSRIEAGQIHIAEREFKLVDILTAIKETFQSISHEAHIPITISVDLTTPSMLIGDELRVRQVLFNFVGNAIKFTPNGEITIEVCPLSSATPDTTRLLFIIRDTGIGMPDDKLASIYDPFVQIENEFTRTRHGAGLGLSITKHLVDRMNGDVTIDSTEGKGTTIYCSIPFKLPKRFVESNGKADTDLASRSDRLRILLVEDEPVNRLGLKRLLEKRDQVVVTAGNGQEALERLFSEDFDVVLMDVQMPVMNGVDATRAIRASSTLGVKARIPIIAMTAYAMAGDKETFLNAGMDQYIAKPIEINLLMDVIHQVLRGKGLSCVQ